MSGIESLVAPSFSCKNQTNFELRPTSIAENNLSERITITGAIYLEGSIL